jgi:hypothetical protein
LHLGAEPIQASTASAELWLLQAARIRVRPLTGVREGRHYDTTIMVARMARSKPDVIGHAGLGCAAYCAGDAGRVFWPAARQLRETWPAGWMAQLVTAQVPWSHATPSTPSLARLTAAASSAKSAATLALPRTRVQPAVIMPTAPARPPPRPGPSPTRAPPLGIITGPT